MTNLIEDMKEKKKNKKKESDFFEKSVPKLESFKSKRSGWVKKFEKKYNHKITDKGFINNNILKTKGQEEIIDKGGYGRLASVILGGSARKIDKKIWDKYKL